MPSQVQFEVGLAVDFYQASVLIYRESIATAAVVPDISRLRFDL